MKTEALLAVAAVWCGCEGLSIHVLFVMAMVVKAKQPMDWETDSHRLDCAAIIGQVVSAPAPIGSYWSWSSVSFLAETSVRSSRKILFFVVKTKRISIKVYKKHFI